MSFGLPLSLSRRIMIRPLPGLTRRDLLPFASGILAPGFSATLSAAVSRHGGARRVRLSLPLFAFLREYAGPLALILPLALALALVRTPATVPTRMAPPAPVAPASVAPMPDTLAATQAPQPVVPAPETTVPDTIAAAAGSAPSEASSAKAPLTYLVQAGDTVGGIAESFGISADTILSANDIDDPTALQIGAELTILPVSALVHTVAADDTLAGIASEYGVSQESIASYNALPDPESLTVGDKLVVPGGRLKVARAATSSRGGARPSAPSGSFQ